MISIKFLATINFSTDSANVPNIKIMTKNHPSIKTPPNHEVF
jgi:hypothetical protein